MNHSAQNSVMGSDSLLIQPELCEVCDGKDEEDLYIVFNALYRVIVGDVFYQGSDNTEKELALNSMSIPLAQQKQKDFKTSQEKLQLFRKKLSSQALIDLVALPRFDLLLREIFKSKYNRVQDTSCKHQELAMNFIRNFNLKNDEFFENSDANKRRLIENTEKLDILYNKIKQLKTEIETYHSEIDGLSEKIVKKLLPHNSHFISKKLNVCDDNDNDSDDQGSDFQETFVEKKPIRNNSDSLINASVSTGLSSESSSNSDKSDEEKLERKHKKSKTATFKSKLPKKATDVLKNWFLNNIQNPYPSHEAKELLSKMTGLTRKQIQNWFTNSRKRFLEPLKKKIEGQKNGKEGSLTLDQANEIFTSETQSPIDPSDLSITQEPIMITQTIVPTQSKTKPAISFASSNLQALNENIIKPVTALQKTSPQMSSPAQSMMYPQANNFVVVPYLVPQPVYPYRPSYPNLLSMSSPQIIPLQQNNYPSNFPLVDTALPNQFGFTMPTNFMDMGAMMKQQMPATFNAMNASLYNSINHQVVNNLQRSTSSLYHPRPELPELNRLGPKFLHKDHGLRVNLG